MPLSTFTPYVLGTNDGIVEECSRFVSELANMLAIKQNELYATITSSIRTKLLFEI